MLPNVSAIYRDLAFMAHPTLHQKSYEQERSSPAQQLFMEKQSRHNQLMEKLRNAQRESCNLTQQLRGTDAPYSSSSSRGSYPHYAPSYQGPDYNTNSNFYADERSNANGRGWKPPNIRYRHIQDRKEPEVIHPQVDYINENRAKQKLQKEFYENPQREKQSLKESDRNEVSLINDRRNKDQEINMKIDDASESSYGRTWINRESKFEDKLESYYDLCRKRPASRKAEPNQSEQPNKSRFTRGVSNRPVGLQLQKAIKMLSLD